MSKQMTLPGAIEHKVEKAAQEGNIGAFYESIQKDPDLLTQLDMKDFVETPLHIAARYGHARFFLEIMRLKPSLARKPNQEGFTPMQLAMQAPQPHTDLVKRLVNVDPELSRVKGRGGMTLLHCAAEMGNVDLLLTFLSVCPESVKELTILSETALHVAVKNRKFEACEFLVRWLWKRFYREIIALEEKVLNWKDDEGNTVFHIAVSTNQPQVLKLLIDTNKIDVNARNHGGLTALDILERQRQLNVTDTKTILTHAKAKRDASLPKTTTPLEYITSKGKFHANLTISFLMRFSLLLPENRNSLLVVAALIATTTYQAVLNPPGGVWDDSTDGHIAGKSRMDATLYYFYQAFNSTAFLASMALIFVLVPLGLWNLLLEYSLIICFVLSLVYLSPIANVVVIFYLSFTLVGQFLVGYFITVAWLKKDVSLCREIIAPSSCENWRHQPELYETSSNRLLVSAIIILIISVVFCFMLMYYTLNTQNSS